jgi:hypothetical protein
MLLEVIIIIGKVAVLVGVEGCGVFDVAVAEWPM